MKSISTDDLKPIKYAGSDTAGGTAFSVNGFKIWVGTEEEYIAIEDKAEYSLYFVLE